MSDVGADECSAMDRREVFEPHRGRETALGPLMIWRALPVAGRRLIGPWCFLDRYGPITFEAGKPMDVAPHPHIGLQTVSWLLDGEVVHHDSIGCEGLVTPGGVNVMTAGSGIAHVEETPMRNSGRLNGVQLWVALPEAERRRDASFQPISEVPRIEERGGFAQLFMGSMGEVVSPADAFSNMIGADLTVHRGETLALPLEVAREHGIFLLGGDAQFESQDLAVNTLYYLGSGRGELALRSATGARVLLIGGVPFGEKVLMWWNFVARTADEIRVAREDWQNGRRFGAVSYDGPRIEAPPLVMRAPANPAS